MQSIKNQHGSEMSPQINSQGPLSDLHGLYLADEFKKATEMAELKICLCPGKARIKSKVKIKMTTRTFVDHLGEKRYSFLRSVESISQIYIL